MITKPLEKYNLTKTKESERFSLLFCQYEFKKVEHFLKFVDNNKDIVNKFCFLADHTHFSANKIHQMMRKKGWFFDVKWTSFLARYYIFNHPQLNGRFKFRTPFQVIRNKEYRRAYEALKRKRIKEDPKKYAKYLLKHYKANLKTRYGDYSEAVYVLKQLEKEIVNEKSKEKTRVKRKSFERCDVDYLERTT